MGRKKKNTVKKTVSAHPEVFSQIRKYAKELTEEQIKKDELKDKKI